MQIRNRLIEVLNIFFTNDELDYAIARVTRKLALKKDEEYQFSKTVNKDMKKYKFTYENGSASFYIIENAVRIFILEDYIKKENDEYTKKVMTIRINKNQEVFVVDHEVFNGENGYEIVTLKLDKKLDQIDKKGLQKTV